MTLRLALPRLRNLIRMADTTPSTQPLVETRPGAEREQEQEQESVAESGLNTPLDVQDAPGPSRLRAADKWVKANGPPVGVQFGARRIEEGADLWAHNAW
jgi:hypothetical protein